MNAEWAERMKATLQEAMKIWQEAMTIVGDIEVEAATDARRRVSDWQGERIAELAGQLQQRDRQAVQLACQLENICDMLGIANYGCDLAELVALLHDYVCNGAYVCNGSMESSTRAAKERDDE